MHKRRDIQKTGILWAMLVLAAVYIVLLYSLHTLTGTNVLDGSIGILLGLYICSHPAANAVDVLFYERGAFQQLSSEWAGLRWLALNMLVLLAGDALIIVGAVQLFSPIT